MADPDRPTDPSSDGTLNRATDGDGDGIEVLLERHLPGLRAYIRLRAGAQFRAQESTSDLVQTVCREVLQRLDRFQHDSEGGFKQWLYTTAQRKIIDRYRFYNREKRDVGREVRSSTPPTSSNDNQLIGAYATLRTPSREAMMREEVSRVERAFDQLPDDFREVIIQHRIVGLPHKEIAEAMGRSEEAVRKLLSRALARLSSILSEGGE